MIVVYTLLPLLSAAAVSSSPGGGEWRALPPEHGPDSPRVEGPVGGHGLDVFGTPALLLEHGVAAGSTSPITQEK